MASIRALLLILLIPAIQAASVDQLIKEAPKVFIDCKRCDIDYIKTHINFVNYVWEPREADIHILITTQRTGSGGREYTITFIGRGRFSDLQSTLKYYTSPTDTWEEIRSGLTHVIKLGLAPYVARTPIADLLQVEFRAKPKPTAVKDKWNFWVFSTSLHARLRGEKRTKSSTLWTNLSANRVTPDLKIRIGLSGRFDEQRFTVKDKEIRSSYKNLSFSSLVVKSLGEHWSAGGWLAAVSSTYTNIKFALGFYPAIEYNFFPYSQFTRRQFRVLYRLGFLYHNYFEETIYDKMEESLVQQILTLTFEMIEPWGDVEISLEGSNYLHDFRKNRLIFSIDMGVRLFRGLSLDIRGSYSAIHDQIYLPKGEATLEEVLLRRKELESHYRYYLSFGFRYRFGSIFSNVVNPRFGS